MSDDRAILLTPEEAISLLPEGEYVHNYANPGAGVFIGIDFERADAEQHIKKALQIEIGGPVCQNMKHGLVVWESDKRCTFFQTDMAKLKAMESTKQSMVSSD